MTSETDSKRIYRQPLNYENGVLLPLIRDIAYWRVTDEKAYQQGVKTLSLVLPSELRSKAIEFYKGDTISVDLTGDGKKDIDDLYVCILQLLEDHNICFPKISYDVGHD